MYAIVSTYMDIGGLLIQAEEEAHTHLHVEPAHIHHHAN
jgi:hypothetical protein